MSSLIKLVLLTYYQSSVVVLRCQIPTTKFNFERHNAVF